MPLTENFQCRAIGPCRVTPQQMAKITRVASKFLGIRGPSKIYIKNAKRGYAHPERSWISFPHWLLHHDSKAYIIAYIVHEVAHFKYLGHGENFKRVERRLLARFGLGIVHNSAYPRRIFALKTRKILFEVVVIRR